MKKGIHPPLRVVNVSFPDGTSYKILAAIENDRAGVETIISVTSTFDNHAAWTKKVQNTSFNKNNKTIELTKFQMDLDF